MLIVTVACAVLFDAFGSGVVLPAVAVAVTEPLPGATKLIVQLIALPTPRLATGGIGTQFTVDPPGNPLTAHVALAPALGPAFVQLNVPFTTLPAAALPGKLIPATMSAEGADGVVDIDVLFAGFGSDVVVATVAVLSRLAPANAASSVPLIVYVFVAPTASVPNAQLTVCPAMLHDPASAPPRLRPVTAAGTVSVVVTTEASDGPVAFVTVIVQVRLCPGTTGFGVACDLTMLTSASAFTVVVLLAQWPGLAGSRLVQLGPGAGALPPSNGSPPPPTDALFTTLALGPLPPGTAAAVTFTGTVIPLVPLAARFGVPVHVTA